MKKAKTYYGPYHPQTRIDEHNKKVFRHNLTMSAILTGYMLVFLGSILLAKFVVAQQPAEPDYPFLPYPYKLLEVGVDTEKFGWALSVDADAGRFTDPKQRIAVPVITDWDSKCPVELNALGPILEFKAFCKGVYEDKNRYVVPTGCVISFTIEGHNKGMYRAPLCPIELKKFNPMEGAI